MYFILLCFLFNPASPNKDNLIDLGALDYFFSEDLISAKITFISKESGIQLKVKCPKHVKCTGNVIVECSKSKSMQLDLEVTKRISKVVIPFTVFCTTDNKFKNANTIQNLEVTHDNKRIYSGWLQNKTGNFSHYFVICMSSAGDIQIIKMTDNVLILTGLKDQTWYQVCAANVDSRNTISRFLCKKVLFIRTTMYTSYTNLTTSYNMKSFSREDILKHKSTDEIISELVDLDSSNVNITVVPNGERLNISWEINDGMRGSIFAYILLIKMRSNVCENAIYFVCSNCKAPLNSKYLSQTDIQKLKSLRKCGIESEEYFDIAKISFSVEKKFNRNLSNAITTFYAINLQGVHQIRIREIVNYKFILIPYLPIVLSISIILFLIYMKKRNLSFICRSKRKSPKCQMPTRVLDTDSLDNTVFTLNHGMDSWSLYSDNSMYFNTQTSKNEILESPVTSSDIKDQSITTNKRKMVETLSDQFEKLMKESKDQESLLHLTTSKGENANKFKKNRFVNIIPYDQNRVKVGEEEYPGNYINASYIPYDNDANKYEYIATQGPTENTLKEFWQMIWQENVKFIIMLTKLDKNNVQYWPDKTGDHLSVEGFSILLLDDLQHDGHVERKMIISDEYDCRKEITQFHMNTWLDECAPNIEYFNKFLFRFHEVASNASNHPYLVHCSSGICQTGTFICIDRITRKLSKGKKIVNIFETVLKLRRFRKMMVQNQVQYTFIHEYIHHFLNKYLTCGQNQEEMYFNEI